MPRSITASAFAPGLRTRRAVAGPVLATALLVGCASTTGGHGAGSAPATTASTPPVVSGSSASASSPAASSSAAPSASASSPAPPPSAASSGPPATTSKRPAPGGYGCPGPGTAFSTFPTDPVAYAEDLYNAWTSAKPEAICELVALNGTNPLATGVHTSTDNFVATKPFCQGTAGSYYCTLYSSKENRTLVFRIETQLLGQPHAVIEVAFHAGHFP